MKRYRPTNSPGSFLLVLAALALFACGDDEPTGPGPDPQPDPDPEPDVPEEVVTSESVTPNPSGYAPLMARIDLETSIPVSVELRVAGRNGTGSDVIHTFTDVADVHAVPVLGLYADHENTVELTLFDAEGTELETRAFAVQTPPAPSYLPEVVIDEANETQMVDGMTLVSYFGHDGDPNPMRPFFIDRYGDVRWVLDYQDHPELAELTFGDGVERLANGNLYFGNLATNRIYEIDVSGEILNDWEMPGFGFHHQVFEKPDGNFLVSVHNLAIETVEDHVIEIDRQSGAILTVWDLRESLDMMRQALSDDEEDWVHVNAVAYDAEDDAIIVSGRVQGLIKLTRDNEVVWILAPHLGWGTAGDGTDLSTKLLQPLDAAGLPITDPDVLSGDANHPEFEWNWYQHAPLIMPNGNILLFDNGDNRNYVGTGPYSRAVEYRIDEAAGTVQQVWSYGKERGTETYSRIVSDVDYSPEQDNVFFLPGAVEAGGYGKVIEVDRASQAVVFEATITPPMTRGPITFHRTERLNLYP